jgi:excisionase family DNA binding protein
MPQSSLAAALGPQNDLLDNEQAAAYLGVTPRTLEVWRAVKRHKIKYLKVGRLVRYRRAELDRWLVSRTVGDDDQ